MSAAEGAQSLGARMAEAMKIETLFSINVGKLSIPVSETVVISWVVMAVIILACFFAGRRLKQVPRGFQILSEWFVGFINDFAQEQLGRAWWLFAPYLGSLALFIVLGSIVGIFSPVAAFGHEAGFHLKPPTRDINVAAALACASMALVFYSHIRYQGIRGWLKSLLHPLPFMLPFNILEYVIKPVSLALRLFGNELGAFIIMELLVLSAPLVVPPIASLYFDFLDSIIQAVVFIMLTTLYLREAVIGHEGTD